MPLLIAPEGIEMTVPVIVHKLLSLLIAPEGIEM